MSRLADGLKSPRVLRIGKWLFGILLVFGFLGYFAAPPLLKSVLQKQLSAQLHRDVSIEKIAINPFGLSAKVNGLSIKADGGKEVAGFDEFFVDLSSASIFKFAAVVDEVRLQGLRIAVARLADGRYDISDLLDEWMKPKDEPEKETPRFSVNNIQLINAKVVFDDQPKGKVHTISDINLALPFVSSLPYQTEILVNPSFSANINGSPLALTGDSKPFSETRESKLDLDLDRFDLAGLQPYLPDSLPFKLKAGTLDSELKVMFKELPDKVYSVAVIGRALFGPVVEIMRVAAHIDHGVDGRRAADHLAAWRHQPASAEMRFRLGRKTPVVMRHVHGDRQCRRHLDQRSGVGAAELDDDDRVLAVLGQTVGHGRSGRAGTDDDEIGFEIGRHFALM